MERAVTEAELAKRLREGATIRGVLVVYRRPELGGNFAPYLRLSGGTAYLALATYRQQSLRTYRDFARLMAALDAWQYRGSVRVIRDDDPQIGRLKLTGAPAEP